MKRDELNDLNAFIAIADERSFTRAAAKMGISQSALSHKITRLEARLGVRLLSRTTRSVSPTDVGERLLAGIAPAFAQIEDQLDLLGELREKPAGLIRITAPGHATRTVLWPAVTKLMRDYPEVEIELSVDSGLRDIVEDKFDAGVRLGEQVARDMIAVRIGPELRMAAVASPDYLQAHGTPRVPQDLAAHRCVNLRMTTAGGLYAWEFEKDGRELNVRVEGQFTSNNVDVIIDAAIGGFGLAFVPDDYVQDAVDRGQLVRVLENWCEPFAGYHLYYPSRRQPKPAFALLIEALRYRA
ncbi:MULTISPECIES: LysR family transcriptional regulator [unclassified Novosphingobium]|uniref:LysR family transcriptional regulator n=1 Tax=unclassified Novosphingobium TaxID=2644732 RepID=UPI0006C87582|nr:MULTISPECIES: LysR family transcriptional regulator [unclassified Novosphingobium]KPH61632.1 LysR family transcriptional regulator [Novosphingobium sp. ST904]MPS69509.1 LysR family transcriptional regulator [Novosphingobium sp.]TCM40788.1 DNA-binding transcriptional LysR family regulator [Novosphingobium sp. ST904]